MIKLVIDGRIVEAEEGTKVLEVARKVGIHIPTLCHHDAVSPSGACRLCIVEVYPWGSTVSSLTTACNFPVEDGMEVWTHTGRVLDARRLTLELLLAKAPESKLIRNMAEELGIETSPFTMEAESTCILCNLCVGVCREAVKVDALRFITRGISTEPHIEALPDRCIGCGACSLLCPTGFIKMEELKGERLIWDRTFNMKKCFYCGSYTMTEAHWKYMEEKLGPSNEFEVAKERCPVCRQDASVLDLLDLSRKSKISLYKS